MSFGTVNGTATTSDKDYVAKSGTLTFASGETRNTITIGADCERVHDPQPLEMTPASAAISGKSNGSGSDKKTRPKTRPL
jgi:hypothetical protein